MTTRYDDIAEWYNAHIQSIKPSEALIVPELLRMTGEVHGLHLCDLACGQGHISRHLGRAGAHVTGIDLSGKLLGIAQEEERQRPLGIRYQLDDAQTLSSLGDHTQSGCVSNLALMDIPNFRAVVAAVKRVLKPEAFFVFSITHPCFQAPEARWEMRDGERVTRVIPEYFQEREWWSVNAESVRGRVGAHHRTLSTYINTLIQAGFTLEAISEPQATGELGAIKPEFATIPPFMVMRWSNAASR